MIDKARELYGRMRAAVAYRAYSKEIDRRMILDAHRVLKKNMNRLDRPEYLDTHVELYHTFLDCRVGNGHLHDLEIVMKSIGRENTRLRLAAEAKEAVIRRNVVPEILSEDMGFPELGYELAYVEIRNKP